ncbi:uracil phosphoribosyltransferase [Polytolypa hystricis UAMH7299]|uniref:uracil phosphoribosyltransferase n=1 Tax=Polytolypa hystricis (strain UAMH7299) TaxID=1447883 RepID=A0A2B7WXT7_POLH7|nr:uracil phosphoribosyltransferase [Polytolypa hystricis UAMH7299]
MAASLPPNVHISTHPCLRAKLSQLRSASTSSKETNALVHDITLILGCEALAKNVEVSKSGTDKTPLGYEYSIETLSPSKISLIPILRSGLGMIQATQALLPTSVPVHHLGLFREPTTLQPVEYYNNLPSPSPSASTPSSTKPSTLAILLDPIIATGGTAAAAIQTLREWGVEKVLMISVLGSVEGVRRAAEEWGEGVEIWIGAVDEGGLDGKGMIVPGLGDVGDRLFLAAGK